MVYHYRNVPNDDLENVINEITEIVHKYGFKTVPAHLAIEIKPPVVWNKGEYTLTSNVSNIFKCLSYFACWYGTGHAALMIMDEFFESDWPTKNIRVLFMGDDTSDEDVMKVSSFIFNEDSVI